MMRPMSQYEKHVFVCTHGPYCWYDGDVDAIFSTLKRLVSRNGLKDRIRVNRSGCLNQCGHGPMVVIYPEAVWYHLVQVDDVEEIFQAHLLNGQVVERLRYNSPPGNNKTTGHYPSPVHRMKQMEQQLDQERQAARDALRAEIASDAAPTADPPTSPLDA